MINEHLVGTWWIHKPDGNPLYTYKGPSPPEKVSERSASFADDAEFVWMDLNNPTDHCWSRNCSFKERVILTPHEFRSVVDTSLLDDMKPGDTKQIEIFKSGNWVMYD